MATVSNEDRTRLHSQVISVPKAKTPNVPKVKPLPLLSNQARLLQEDGKRRSTPLVSTQSQSSGTNKRGSKRRVSDSTPGWNPINMKRPRSEGDSSTARTLHFSPYALPVQQVQKSHERSLEWFSQQIWTDFCRTRQTRQRYEQKCLLRDYLLSIFRTTFPGCSLNICGSTCSGLATNDSDVDLCLLLSSTREIDQRFEARRILHQLHSMLKKSTYIQKCHVIYAKVPILKFRDLKSGCECDVNINNTVGIKNTHLLQGYCGYDWRVCPLIMIIKKWAKRHCINDASQGTLSSYSMAMMVLHYLQDPCQPPVIPVLQYKYPEVFNATRNIHELCGEDPFSRITPERSNNQETLGELLLGFFRYYAEEFRWDEDVICVRQGSKYPRGNSNKWLKKFICIEEPFDLSCVARAVHTQDKFDEIKQRIKIAYYTLKVSPYIESILSGS